MTSKEPILIDGVSVTDLVVITHRGVRYEYRQLIPGNWVAAKQDIILHVGTDTVYTVAATAFDMVSCTLIKISVLESDGETIKFLNLNEIRILHDINTFNPALN